MKFLLLVSLCGLAFGVNHHGFTFEQIVQMVVRDTDANADGFISFAEFDTELLGQFDTDGNGIVSDHDFITLWMAKYGDTHADTHHFFTNLDANSDKQLTEADIVGQLSELKLTLFDALNPSAVQIPVADFADFIRINHPHGHGHGGKRANQHGFTFEQIVQMVVRDTDANADGFISFAEFDTELLGQFDTDGNGIVSDHDFITLWMAKYGDTHADTHHFFTNLDANSDKQLTEADIVGQLSELKLTLFDALNPSAVQIPVADFADFIRINHPHGHGHGGKRANTHGFTFDQIVQMVLTDTDSDADGFISLQEFEVELLGQFDLNNDGIVPSHDFINLWMAKYGDTHADTNHFFTELDANSDKQLTEADILAQLSELNLGLLDILNPSAVRIPLVDFENFIRINHPHGHGHGGR